jgi:AraC-like DNA-binding protein
MMEAAALAWPTSQSAGLSEDSCAAHPTAPPACWAYRQASIGFVTSGWFEYASEGITTLAAPGAVILGNAGEAFSVRHVDTLGNRRLVTTFAPELMREVANDAGIAPRFRSIALPPGPAATHLFGLMRAFTKGGADMLYFLAYAALTAEPPGPRQNINPRDLRRVQNAVRHIEVNFGQPCSLQTLAEHAGLSRFHFVRMFSAVVGQSPNQYLINTRMRAAAERLTTTASPITQIAFDVGFNDISHFYACFREAFSCTPLQWRRRG